MNKAKLGDRSPTYYHPVRGDQEIYPSAQRLGNMGAELEIAVPFRLSKENQVPNNDVSVGGDQYTPHKYYYTLVLKNYSKVASPGRSTDSLMIA
nr:hypothetical transcript [Hymenolepis microstoma]